MGPPRRERPEVAIEWLDVTIDIKVCGVDVPPEDRDFVQLYPQLDPMLVSRVEVDATKGMFRKKREKLQKFEYKLVQPDNTEPLPTKVLPKLTCEHCGKSFSRRSTLEQHVALHGAANTTGWEEIQDAALEDLEQAALAGELHYDTFHKLLTLATDDEHEVDGDEATPSDSSAEAVAASPPTPAGTGTAGERRCPTCGKMFSRQSLLNRHLKLHAGIRPYLCNTCGRRFLQRYNLKKHLWTHSLEKPHKCGQCSASYTDLSSLKAHMHKQHPQGTVETGGSLSTGSGPKSDTPLERVNGKALAGSFPCPKCDRIFAAKAHLDRHLPAHMPMVKPYSCHVCGWRFHLLHNMQRHLATHDKKKVDSPEKFVLPTTGSALTPNEKKGTLLTSSQAKEADSPASDDDGLLITVTTAEGERRDKS